MTVLTNVLSLIVACIVGVGPVALLAVLQNRRDRRAQALFHEVASQLPSEALRSDVALDVRCRLFSRGATVRLDLGRAASSPHLGDRSPASPRASGLGAARGGRARGRPSGRSAPGPHHRREPGARAAPPSRLILGRPAPAAGSRRGPVSCPPPTSVVPRAPARAPRIRNPAQRVADLTRALPGDDCRDRSPRGRVEMSWGTGAQSQRARGATASSESITRARSASAARDAVRPAPPLHASFRARSLRLSISRLELSDPLHGRRS